jgi:coenzyme PQQ synthesis protein D (PqqD)
VTFDTRLRVPEQVLVSDVDGESVILNLRTEALFSLDAVGTRMLTAVTAAESVQAAYDRLVQEYDVEPQLLRDHLVEMLDSLLEHGLLEVHSS